MMTLLSSKFLLFAAVSGVFVVAEVVQQGATQSGITLILNTVAHEIVTAIFAVGLGCFFLRRTKKSSKQMKLEKKQLKADLNEPDSDVSTAEGDSDGPNDDSDSEGIPSANVTPRRQLSPAMPKMQTPSPQMYSRPKPRIVRDDLKKPKTEQYSDSWRQDAAKHQATPDTRLRPRTRDAEFQDLPGAKALPEGGGSKMPSSLSAGGCALLQLLREENKSKLTKEGATEAVAAPPGL